ncbi:MAG: transmembrane 220 family protein [Bacteroidota bacterium]
MARKISNGLIALLFLLFAYFQLNDHDSLRWILLYGYVALVAILAVLGKPFRGVALGGAIMGTIWLAFLVPNLVDWLSLGMPSITESMKADSPYVELTREFFGVLISVLALWGYFVRARFSRQ